MVEHATSDASPLPPIVLLVNDDRDMLDSYAAHFEASGMWVATSTQPSEAMDTVQELRPNLIVADLGPDVDPEHDGAKDFVHALKSTPVTQHIPLIILAARSASDAIDVARKAADLWLVKPVQPEALLLRARHLLDKTQD